MKFDTDNIADIREAIERAMKKIEDGYGVKLNVGVLRYTPQEESFSFSVQGSNMVNWRGDIITSTLLRGMKLHGINLVVDDKGSKLVDYHMKNKNDLYPFHYITAAGAPMRCTVQAAQQRWRDFDAIFPV